MAFAIFADTPVDVMVLEVGVGGRLDCTNVADGVVAVITPISIDHTRLLGNTIEEIAGEKAGIIKPGATRGARSAAAGGRRGAAQARRRGGRHGSPGGRGVRRAEPRAGGRRPAARPCAACAAPTRTSSCRCSASYQAGNAACALAAVEAFAGVADDDGYGRPRSTPTWCGRRSRRSPRPDGWKSSGAAPPSSSTPRTTRPGMAATVAAVQESFTFNHLAGVFAASGDKDVARHARRTRAAARPRSW